MGSGISGLVVQSDQLVDFLISHFSRIFVDKMIKATL